MTAADFAKVQLLPEKRHIIERSTVPYRQSVSQLEVADRNSRSNLAETAGHEMALVTTTEFSGGHRDPLQH